MADRHVVDLTAAGYQIVEHPDGENDDCMLALNLTVSGAPTYLDPGRYHAVPGLRGWQWTPAPPEADT